LTQFFDAILTQVAGDERDDQFVTVASQEFVKFDAGPPKLTDLTQEFFERSSPPDFYEDVS
jgi:hypothetical protein